MLLPIHFSIPEGVPFEAGQHQFEVIWYAKFQNWVLVTWEHRTGAGAEGTFSGNVGQSLWEGREQKTWSWLQLDLGQRNERREEAANFSTDPRLRISKTLGNYGVPPLVANKLFDEQNRVWFQARRWE